MFLFTFKPIAVYAILIGCLPITGAFSAAAQDKPPHVLASRGEPELQERRMPEAIDIGSLTWESDFTAFMTATCPEEVRSKALRRLWSLMPLVVLDENPAI
jgi:hypothetical protein